MGGMTLKGGAIRTDAEGSRGGKVIGHTPSGKAVYASSGDDDHSGWESYDHRAAASLHHRAATKHDPKSAEYSHHINEAGKHRKWSKTAMNSFPGRKQESAYDKLLSGKQSGDFKGQKAKHLDVGEGSRGGKVIGHTKSGKPVYDHVTSGKTSSGKAIAHHKHSMYFQSGKGSTSDKPVSAEYAKQGPFITHHKGWTAKDHQEAYRHYMRKGRSDPFSLAGNAATFHQMAYERKAGKSAKPVSEWDT